MKVPVLQYILMVESSVWDNACRGARPLRLLHHARYMAEEVHSQP